MAARHKSRQRAVQMLYQVEMRKIPASIAFDAYYSSLFDEEQEQQPKRDAFAEELVRGVVDRTQEIDKQIQSHSEHWRIERMPVVDRNILRIAVFELQSGKTPAPIVIDEALELARRFSGDESVAFLNGVLDAIRKDLSKT
jgi:transcription antitermination protein NusB